MTHVIFSWFSSFTFVMWTNNSLNGDSQLVLIVDVMSTTLWKEIWISDKLHSSMQTQSLDDLKDLENQIKLGTCCYCYGKAFWIRAVASCSIDVRWPWNGSGTITEHRRFWSGFWFSITESSCVLFLWLHLCLWSFTYIWEWGELLYEVLLFYLKN